MNGLAFVWTIDDAKFVHGLIGVVFYYKQIEHIYLQSKSMVWRCHSCGQSVDADAYLIIPIRDGTINENKIGRGNVTEWLHRQRHSNLCVISTQQYICCNQRRASRMDTRSDCIPNEWGPAQSNFYCIMHNFTYKMWLHQSILSEPIWSAPVTLNMWTVNCRELVLCEYIRKFALDSIDFLHYFEECPACGSNACTYFLDLPIESNYSYFLSVRVHWWQMRRSRECMCVCVRVLALRQRPSQNEYESFLFLPHRSHVSLRVCNSISSQQFLFFSHLNGRLIWYWVMRMRKSQWRKMGNESAPISMSWMNFSIVNNCFINFR